MTAPDASAPDVAAIAARAAERARRRRYTIVSSCHGLSVSPDGTVALVESDRTATEHAGETPEADADVLALLAHIAALRAQHAAEVEVAVAAAVRATRDACAAQLRARAECLRRYAYEAIAKADASEYAHDAREVDACAAIVASVALTAPATTGGG